jgi:UDP-N-acetylmuramoyl-L-alanyl-D-glutamate--2,6-diaminopimelate ligase
VAAPGVTEESRPPAPPAGERRAVPLGRLLAALAEVGIDTRLHGAGEVTVSDIVYDSRQVGPGALFCCVPGQTVDGHRFADAAVEAGAVVLLVEHRLALDVVQVEVRDARAAMAPLAAEFWDHPSRALDVVGVTGTNGKTTVTQLLGSILAAGGAEVGVIGTLSGSRTTPEAPDLQAQLAGMRAAGVRAVAMEVSSHALALHRVDGTRFAVSAFTNLGRDHLDFHGTVEAYFQAKARLFEPQRTARAVVNLDDPHGRLLRDAALVPTVGYSLADTTDVELGADGSRFTWRGRALFVPLAGRHNVSNALAAATIAVELGVELDAVAHGLATASPVPGRFEPVETGRAFAVVVDYAHTPDALERALDAARELVPGDGRVIVVFGCGGDRDRTKRAPMGEVASRLADLTVITSDNPRGEPPLAIIEQVRSGVVPGAEVIVEADRRTAIGVALGAARDGDIVVVAGKGHETTQQVGDVELPFDDRAVAREWFAAGGPSAALVEPAAGAVPHDMSEDDVSAIGTTATKGRDASGRVPGPGPCGPDDEVAYR